MHSFRLRYVALGLLIYIQSAFSRTCGTDFDDVASSAVIADTVLLATATRVVRDSRGGAGAPGNQHAVRFRVERVYKGNIPEADVGDGGGRRKPSLVVASFSSAPDPERCVAPSVTLGSRYVVFLRGDDTEKSSVSAAAVSGEVRTSTKLERRQQKVVARRRRRLRMSAFPVLVAGDVIDTVDQYTNCSNRCRRRPRAKIRPTSRMETSRRKIRLQCRVSGKPPPRVTWYKDGVLLERSVRVRFKTNRRGSRLYIRRSRTSDSGIYQCRADNLVGHSDLANATISVVHPERPVERPFTELCEKQNYCFNGGTCRVMTSLNKKFCECKGDFEGARCQEKRNALSDSKKKRRSARRRRHYHGYPRRRMQSLQLYDNLLSRL